MQQAEQAGLRWYSASTRRSMHAHVCAACAWQSTDALDALDAAQAAAGGVVVVRGVGVVMGGGVGSMCVCVSACLILDARMRAYVCARASACHARVCVCACDNISTGVAYTTAMISPAWPAPSRVVMNPKTLSHTRNEPLAAALRDSTVSVCMCVCVYV